MVLKRMRMKSQYMKQRDRDIDYIQKVLITNPVNQYVVREKVIETIWEQYSESQNALVDASQRGANELIYWAALPTDAEIVTIYLTYLEELA